MGIDEHGFLGEEIKIITSDISKKYQRHFTFFRELFFIDFLDFLDGVSLVSAPVVSYAGYPCEAQRHLALIGWASLDLVVGDFDYYLGQHHYSPTVFADS